MIPTAIELSFQAKMPRNYTPVPIVPVKPEIELKTLEETEIPLEDALSFSEGDFVVVRFGSLS